MNQHKSHGLDNLASAAQDQLDAQALRRQAMQPRHAKVLRVQLLLTIAAWCGAVFVWGAYVFNNYPSNGKVEAALDGLLAEADTRVASYVKAWGFLPSRISDPSLATVVVFKYRNTQTNPPGYVLEAQMDGVTRTLSSTGEKGGAK